MRGQLFSMDFLVAVALVMLAVGVTLQALEFSTRRLALQAELANGTAEALADAYASGTTPAMGCTNPSCCVAYSNGTNSCAGLSCPRHVLTGRRLFLCSGGTPCTLEVRACG